MNIIDLRQTTVRQLEPLLLEEARHWRDELHWDYRSALDLIKRFLDAHALSGCVAFEGGHAVGYSFYVLEDYKGLIGGLYVSPSQVQEPIGRRLLDEMLFSMRALPQLHRIEAQLMPFGGPVDAALRDQGFRLYTRQFMLLDLQKKSDPVPSVNSGLRLDRWHERYFEPCAKLIYLAYANHVDGDINDQYRTRNGALKFLKNIILLPGCGQFLPHASFVLHHPESEELAGGHAERHAVERPGGPVALDEAAQRHGPAGAGSFAQRISLFHFSVHCGRCFATWAQSKSTSLSTSAGPLMIFLATSAGTFTVRLVGLQNSSVAKAS